MAHPNKKVPKLALDSNTFRNFGFINYLIIHKDAISTALPSIVQLEVGYFYLAKGLTWNDFLRYTQKFNAKMSKVGGEAGALKSRFQQLSQQKYAE